MVLSLQDKWIWDSWYAHDGDKWHVYFLQADKSLGDPDLRHWNVTQAHATSADLSNWTHHGTCFAPAAEPAWDDMTTWTGSVLQDDTGLWHLFYTGARKAEDGLVQRIGHATSTDMHNWSRVGSGLCLDISGDAYEHFDPDIWHDRAMRDPWVMRDPDGDGWLMYFTARINGVDEPNAAGAIGFATSPDLNDWTLHPPVFSGGFGQLEVPQVFEQNGRWYCLFCTDKSHWSTSYTASAAIPPTTGSHYLIADNPRGPWLIAPGPFLDGHAPHHRYASRILDTEQGLVIIGFVDRPDGADFVGHITDPDPISIDPNGHLQVRSNTKATE